MVTLLPWFNEGQESEDIVRKRENVRHCTFAYIIYSIQSPVHIQPALPYKFSWGKVLQKIKISFPLFLRINFSKPQKKYTRNKNMIGGDTH